LGLLEDALFNAFKLIVTFDPEIVQIVALTLYVTLAGLALGCAIGIPLGAYLGVKEFRGKGALLRLSDMLFRNVLNTLMGLPPVLVGLALYLVLSRSGPMGGLQLLYTPTAMVLAQFVLVLPIVAGMTMSSIANVDRAIWDRAISLGADEGQVMGAVLREARLGILTAIVVGFGAAISEVGALLIVGGNVRYATRVLTTAIVYETDVGEFDRALALGIILLALAFLANAALTYLQYRQVKK